MLPLPQLKNKKKSFGKLSQFWRLPEASEAIIKTCKKKQIGCHRPFLANAFRGELVQIEAEQELQEYASHIDKLSIAAEP